jgi:hypothetical protein
MEESYVGPIFVGQRWVELKGIFTHGELKAILERIDENFTEVFHDKKIVDSKETQDHLQNLEDAITATLDGEDENIKD